ncbi:bacteriocin [Piscinibacter sakaiensis]|uniref:bacteriocin n=1 Tax=Piscinibacter sakaiensis TaxID=1547922 RepID=UPI003AAB7E92
MRILTIEELMQVSGGGLTKAQKEQVKALKKINKDAAKALKKEFKALNSAAKCTKSGSGKGSSKGTCGPVLS